MNSKDITLEKSVEKQNAFCEAWPSAKIGLELLADVVKNPFVKSAIKLVISAGDAIATSICG
jgi:hypothetical protein